ncbi:lactadherin-like [Argopecten irradians]|uniref:lactadherin-like n=1 Tax=Argopecten irradians TaxID=31199 RepID=UPI00372389D3
MQTRIVIRLLEAWLFFTAMVRVHSQSAPCNSPLVTGNLGVKDSDITANLPYHLDVRCLPKYARWTSPWGYGFIGSMLQVRLREASKITGFAIQSRGSGFNQYVMTYQVKYSYDGAEWTTVKEANETDRIFNGNTDDHSIVTASLDSVIETAYIRVIAVSCATSCAFRFEIFGCPLSNKGKQPTSWKATGATRIPTFDIFKTTKTNLGQCGEKCHKEGACFAFTFNPESGQCEGHSHANYAIVTIHPLTVVDKQNSSLLYVRQGTRP